MDNLSPHPERALERFREYLGLLARVQVEPRLQAKIDLSGVIQQTLLEAYQEWVRIQHWSEAQKAAWLRKVLAHNLTDEMRKFATQARAVAREKSLEAALDQSSAHLGSWLATDEPSPSQNADRNEQALRLAQALAQLPEAQRDALVLQHWHGWSLAEIGRHLNRTPAAVAGLLHRGLDQLRKHLQDREEAP